VWARSASRCQSHAGFGQATSYAVSGPSADGSGNFHPHFLQCVMGISPPPFVAHPSKPPGSPYPAPPISLSRSERD